MDMILLSLAKAYVDEKLKENGGSSFATKEELATVTAELADLKTRVAALESGNTGGGGSGDGGGSAGAFTVDVMSKDSYGESSCVDLMEGAYAYRVSGSTPTLSQMQGCTFYCTFTNELSVDMCDPDVTEESDGYKIKFKIASEVDVSSVYYPQIFVPKASSGYEAGVYVYFESIEEAYALTGNNATFDSGYISFPEV